MAVKEVTIKKREVKIDKKTKEKAKERMREEGQVLVHATIHTSLFGTFLRIWPTTYLILKGSKKKYQLIHFFNITLYPQWMPIPSYTSHTFTLVFPPLPDDCQEFDLIEEIPESGNFEIHNIPRNEQDVYYVEV